MESYLLGELNPADEEQIEVRLLSDPAFAEEFDITVDELIDRYLAGDFKGDELKRVENYFLKAPDRQRKVQFSKALKKTSIRDTPTHKATPTRKDKTFPSIRYLAIAASILVVIGLGFGIWRAFFNESSVRRGLDALQAAYADQRPIEARVSSFSYAPVPNERGAPAPVDIVKRDLASSLLLAEVSQNPTSQSHHAAGQYYLYVRQFGQAIVELNSALVSDPSNARIHSDLGAALLEEAKIQRSGSEKGKEIETFGRSLKHLNKAIELDNSLLEAHFNVALVSQYMLPSNEAAKAWREYLEIDPSSPWADEARRNLKLLEEQRGRTVWNLNEALADFRKSHQIGDDGGAWEVVSQSYTSAGNEITNSLLDSLFEVQHPKVGTEERDLDALSYLARLESERGQDRFTSDLVKNYQRLSLKDRSLLAEGRRHLKAGYSFFIQSKYDDATREYNSAKTNYAEADDRPGEMLADFRLAHCYILQNNLREARLVLTDLRERSERNSYFWIFSQSLYGLAHSHASNNEYSKAIDYSTQALVGFERIGDVNGVLKCLSQLADFNQSVNRTERSLHFLSRALGLAAYIRAEPSQRWGVLVQAGFCLSEMELHEAALLYHQEALRVALELGRPLMISRSYGYLGTAYAALKSYQNALSEATKAFETGRSMSQEAGVEIMANATLQLANIHRQVGQCDKAIEAYDKSIELYRTVHLEYFSYVAHKGKLLCLIESTDNPFVQREIQTVLSLAKLYRSKITNESERLTFFDAEQSVYDLAIKYEFIQAGDPLKAFDYSEASRARSMLDALHRRAEVMNKGFGPDLKLISVDDSMSHDEIQRNMSDEVQIVQYALLDDTLLIWVVTKNHISYEQVTVGSHELVSKVRKWLQMLITQPKDGNLAAQADGAKELYRLLIAPVQRHLDKSKLLFLVPDKILNYVPFGALIDPETSNYLLKDYDIGIAPSSTIFVALSVAATKKARALEEELLSVGNPRFDLSAFESLQYLPSATREAQDIGLLYPKRRILVEDKAGEAIIKSEMTHADVIHLAMHYVINERSELLSGFPLTSTQAANDKSDGLLRSHEIYAMNLPRTRLVVLSACQTGIEQQYHGEGSIGAARPFMVAGVPVVVASLWPVDSDATAKLMTSFHTRRMNSQSTTSALKQAQIEMALGSDFRYRHPYYWAAFVRIGGDAQY